jgi:hypothetical protein
MNPDIIYGLLIMSTLLKVGFWFLAVLRIKPRATHMLGKCSSTVPHPQLLAF